MLTNKQYNAALFEENRKAIQEYRGQSVYILIRDNQANFSVLETKGDFVKLVAKTIFNYMEKLELEKLKDVLDYLFDAPEFVIEDACKDWVLENYDVEYMEDDE